MKAAPLHSSESARSPAHTPPCCLCERVIDGGMVWWIDKRDAEGWNASRGPSDKEGVEAEAGSLGRQRERKGEGQGRRHVARCALNMAPFLLSFFPRKALRMRSEMKGRLWNNKKKRSGHLVMCLLSLLTVGFSWHVIVCRMFDVKKDEYSWFFFLKPPNGVRHTVHFNNESIYSYLCQEWIRSIPHPCLQRDRERERARLAPSLFPALLLAKWLPAMRQSEKRQS